MIEDWLNLLAGNDYDEPRLVELLKTMDIPTRDALIMVAIDLPITRPSRCVPCARRRPTGLSRMPCAVRPHGRARSRRSAPTR